MSYIHKDAYHWISFILFLSSLVMFIMINAIVCRKMKTNLMTVNEESRLRHEMRIMNTFRLIFIVYLLLCCPYFVLKYLEKLAKWPTIFEIDIKSIRVIARHMFILNSCMNSAIYAYRVKAIRDEIKKLFCFSKQRVGSTVEVS